MPTRNVTLTEELEHFITEKVNSGRYEDASDVVRVALRTLKREDTDDESKLTDLRSSIDEGDASGVADGDVFARVRNTLAGR
ncbi:MAG: type II toxin-antitoxin system ParD family antitoxin [Acidobacteriota bacterium]